MPRHKWWGGSLSSWAFTIVPLTKSKIEYIKSVVWDRIGHFCFSWGVQILRLRRIRIHLHTQSPILEINCNLLLECLSVSCFLPLFIHLIPNPFILYWRKCIFCPSWNSWKNNRVYIHTWFRLLGDIVVIMWNARRAKRLDGPSGYPYEVGQDGNQIVLRNVATWKYAKRYHVGNSYEPMIASGGICQWLQHPHSGGCKHHRHQVRAYCRRFWHICLGPSSWWSN